MLINLSRMFPAPQSSTEKPYPNPRRMDKVFLADSPHTLLSQFHVNTTHSAPASSHSTESTPHLRTVPLLPSLSLNPQTKRIVGEEADHLRRKLLGPSPAPEKQPRLQRKPRVPRVCHCKLMLQKRGDLVFNTSEVGES